MDWKSALDVAKMGDSLAAISSVLEHWSIASRDARVVCELVAAIRAKRSIPRPVRRLVEAWFVEREDWQLLLDARAPEPTIAFVLRVIHPKPKDMRQALLWQYILEGQPCLNS